MTDTIRGAAAPTAVEPGTALDALGHRDFRRVFVGSFISNVGRWMQNVVLGAFAWDLTHSPTFVGLVVFAQLGPMLALSVVGGALADALDRRHLLLATQAWQAAWTTLLAVLVADGEIDEVQLVALVAVIGVGQAVFAPTWSAVVPTLAGPGNLQAAIALNSTQINATRVVGPAIGGVLYAELGASPVFAINAVTYVFVIGALLLVTIPRTTDPTGDRGWARLTSGFRIARGDRVVGRSLVVMASFAFFCLPFIGQMPVLAELNLGIEVDTRAYGVLYACFGVGAVLGSLSVGTLLRRIPRVRTMRVTLVGFGLALAALALVRTPSAAYPLIVAVGFLYLATVTSLTTHVQSLIDDAVRGRVMALWTMSFGGVVPLANLVAGPLIELTSVTTVLLVGALAAAALSWRLDLEPMSSRRQ